MFLTVFQNIVFCRSLQRDNQESTWQDYKLPEEARHIVNSSSCNSYSTVPLFFFLLCTVIVVFFPYWSYSRNSRFPPPFFFVLFLRRCCLTATKFKHVKVWWKCVFIQWIWVIDVYFFHLISQTHRLVLRRISLIGIQWLFLIISCCFVFLSHKVNGIWFTYS